MADQNRREERSRERRREEEENLARAERRQREAKIERNLRAHIEDSGAHRRSGSGVDTPAWLARVEGQSLGRPQLQRVLSALERASDLLAAGAGGAAQALLSKEARQALAEAGALKEQPLDARLLRTLAANLELRAKLLDATYPEEAVALARRLLVNSRGTEQRSQGLAIQGHVNDARLLSGLSVDARAQAALLSAAAVNLQTLIGRGLLRALSRIGDASLAQADAGQAPNEARMQLGQLFASVEKGLIDRQCGLHMLADAAATEAHPVARRAEGLVPLGTALNRLADKPLVGDLLASFQGLSSALCAGDVDQINAARQRILAQLEAAEMLGSLEIPLGRQKLPASATQSAAAFAEDGLSRLVLRGLFAGNLGALAGSDPSSSLEGWLRKIPLPQAQEGQMLPAEQVLSALNRTDPLTAESAAPKVAQDLLPGTKSLWTALATVSEYVRTHPDVKLDGTGPSFGAGRLATLGPVGPGESAVLVDSQGGVMVRTSGGPEWHQGHFVDAAGERTYYDVHASGAFSEVVFSPAGEPEQAASRLDLELNSVSSAGAGGDAAVEGELLVWQAGPGIETDVPDATEERPKQRRRKTRPAPQELAALVLDCPGPSAGKLLATVDRRAAASFAQTLAAKAGGAESSDWLLVPHATEVEERLLALGRTHAGVIQARLLAQLAAMNLPPASIAALVLRTDAETGRALAGLGPGDAAMFPADEGAPCLIPGPVERFTQPELAKSGVLLWAGKDAIVVD